MVMMIFGAGASHGSGGCHPSKPPLGGGLFKELVAEGGEFSKLDAESKMAFESGDFEAGMATISTEISLINQLHKELACFFMKYEALPSNAYVKLFRKLREVINKVNITTLNYDLLIERALGLIDFGVDYNARGNAITLLKPHGSANFLPQWPDNLNIQMSGNVIQGTGSITDNMRTNAVITSKEVFDWCNDSRNEILSPILCMYAKGKRVVLNKTLINNIQKDYAELVKKSQLVVLAGIRYIDHDTHIWQPILESNAKLLIVDPYPEATIEWAEQNGLKYKLLQKGFDTAVDDIAESVKSTLMQ